MTFFIECNKPMPEPGHHRIKYPFRQMNVGESFSFACDRLVQIQSAVSQFSRRNSNYKFTIRKIDANTYCVWRIQID